MSVRIRNSRVCPPTTIVAPSSRISTHLIASLSPLGSFTLPDSPGSNVRPLIMAMRLGGLLMPFRIRLDVSSVSFFGVGFGISDFEFGKNGFRPSLGLAGIVKTDSGMGISGAGVAVWALEAAGATLSAAVPQ